MTVRRIVVLAYGPGQVTSAAVDRARGLADDVEVHVVPAVDPATRFVRRTGGRGVVAAAAIGRAGLEAALAGMGADDAVLVLHDDVLLDRDGLTALATEHGRAGGVAVPWSNDRQSEASIGSLPPLRRAAAEVAHVARQTDERRILHRVRPNCLVATAAQVARLAQLRVTVARTVLAPHGLEVTAAPHAVVAHDNTCLDQLADPRRTDGRPLVTAALIVRDEEELLPDCLASLTGFVDRIVVCDTGSTDGTLEIARAAGATILERVWRNDFAWARNEALTAARESWYVLQVDADERLEVADPDELRQLLLTDAHDADGFMLHIDNLDSAGRVSVVHQAPRLFRPDGVAYLGALHEVPVRDGAPIASATLEGVRLRHLGYTGAVMQARAKSERNVAIARAEYDEQPGPAPALNLARSLLLAGVVDDEVERLLDEAVDGDLLPRARAHALGIKAQILLARGEADEARLLADRALAMVPLDDEAGSVHARACLQLGHPADAVERHRWRLEAPSVQPYSTSTTARGRELAAVAQSLVALDDLPGAAAAATAAAELAAPLEPQEWQDVVAILALADRDHAPTVLREAALRDPTGTVVRAFAKVYPVADTATFVAGLAATGQPGGTVVQLGLAAAVAARREDLATRLAAHAATVPQEALQALMARAQDNGLGEAAAAIGGALLAGL